MDNQDWSFKDEFWFNVTFLYRGRANHEVYLTGDFNEWRKQDEDYKMKPCEEGYGILLSLREGYYHYKFIVDGELVRDHHNPHVGGQYGNSIMFVNMDPKVYGLRNQDTPFREYQDRYGSQFHVLNPVPPTRLQARGILQRLIFIYLPPSYYASPERRYPVVYAHDGQNLFSTPEGRGGPPWGGWYLDAKLDWVWSEGMLPEFILVAIPNSDYVCIGNRQWEYTAEDFGNLDQEPYVQYVTEFLKPFIDEKYQTVKNESHIIGASLGGLMAFLLSLALPTQVFVSCVCLSPSFWFVDQKDRTCFSVVRNICSEKDFPKVYIDSGDGDGDNKELVSQMAKLLGEKGLREGTDYRYVFDRCRDRVPCGVTHSEWVWRERVLDGLKFILNNSRQ